MSLRKVKIALTRDQWLDVVEALEVASQEVARKERGNRYWFLRNELKEAMKTSARKESVAVRKRARVAGEVIEDIRLAGGGE